MPFVEWTQTQSVGIESVDNEHRQLMALLNDLHEGFLAGQSKDVLSKIFDAFVTTTSVHFQHEEGYFEKTGYPGAAAHKKEHAALFEQVKAVHARYRKEPTAALSMEMMTFLRDWLLDHIEETDKAYSRHLIANGIR